MTLPTRRTSSYPMASRRGDALRPIACALGMVTIALAHLVAAPQRALAANTFGADIALLKKYTDVVVLSNTNGTAEIAVVPKYQGRVMTSTSSGDSGTSYGWINPKLIASGKFVPHMNLFGGEDRVWLGPEGGQFGLFFKKRCPFDLTHWQVPSSVDTRPWKIASRTKESVTFRQSISEANYSGTKFNVTVDRTVKLINKEEVAGFIGGDVPDGINCVAYESDNTLTNDAKTALTKSKGLISIWILGQFNAAPATVVVLPYKPGPASKLGIIVNDSYFGKVPGDRLKVDASANIIAFKADGHHRSKIGVNYLRAQPNYGSYDPISHVLTIIQYSSSVQSPDFVNSMWEIQKKPYSGDELNSYNDGGLFGPFYEIESSSPAIPLATGASITHVHRTIHLQGDPASLDPIAVRLFGAHLSHISSEFK